MKISIEEKIVFSHLAHLTALLTLFTFDIFYHFSVSNDLYILPEINV